MAGYSKLFSSILTSSIWLEDHGTRIVWIAMLASCDANGVVEGSTSGFAHAARVTIPEMKHAIKRLTAPDEDSRNPGNEGRRIEVIDGGWRIINYPTYREKLQGKPKSGAGRQRAYRARNRNALHPVTDECHALPKVTTPASASASVPGVERNLQKGTDVHGDDLEQFPFGRGQE